MENAKGSVVAAGLVLIAIVAIVALGFGMMLLYPGYDPGLLGQEVLKKFSSCQELESFLEEKASSQGYGMYSQMAAMGAPEGGADMLGTPAAAPPPKAAETHSEDYSTTNIQVEGVDEADIVKSDVKYLYIVTGGKVVIVDAYPAEEAEIVSEMNITGSPSELFINDDRMVIFTYGRWGGKTASSIFVYDVSDRSNPVIKRNLTLEGNYYDSRMIGDYIYVISKKYVYGWTEPGIPRIATSAVGEAIAEKPVCNCVDVYYFDVPDYNYQFTTITSLNVKDDSVAEQSKVFLMGYSQNLFVSQNNIYITYKKSIDQIMLANRMIDEVIIPVLPPEIASQMVAIKNSNTSEWEKMQEMSRVLMNYTESLGPEQGAEFMQEMQNRSMEFLIKVSKEIDQSVVHKVSINNGNIEYAAGGKFPGMILNQFSMDEYNGYFRVATTTGGWVGGMRTDTLNNVDVLDSNLNIVGKLEDLAKGESIYSARFMGDRLYMVTFQRIDPLFVIDLSNPASPTVLGELKIPGYSDYLHPYDDNHVIGIGMDTEENQWGGISTSGIKLSLFDVTDVANPQEVSKYVIGGRGAYSIALHEHKAFLFNKNKELLVIPARVHEENGKNYWSNYWHGAYVFQINLVDGFKYRGRIAHQEEVNETERWYNYQYDVKRSMYMDDVLYTLSESMIKMNSLINLEDINSVELPSYEYRPIPPPIEVM
ncbi:MAG: beta-propeller domain-containing protein [Candidatus Aenigmatarchaeota archaeon]|nr:MAG: beta-propeller domain-containing protein [Candidatus Aenigmarchaeota archaeon]